MEEDRLHADKPSNRRHVSARNGYALHDREPEALSDSEDDEEFLRTHSSHLVKYMIDIHKRRKRVLEEYEHKREQRRAKMQDQLARIYEKRLGSKSSMRPITGDDVMTIPINILLRSTKGASDLSKKHYKRQGDRSWKKYMDANNILSRVQATRMGNCKKVAQYCQKEARRAATKSGRAHRDIQNKAKKAMKEMLMFWKKNEKEERELRKKAEKEALERIRLEEERREAQRQARKLNFLITQTELYSHFIGKKIKTSAAEEDDETATEDKTEADGTSQAAVDDHGGLDETEGHKEMDEVDFDEDDEEKLREQAKRGAQNALAMQLERTKAFDEGARERRAAADSGSSAMPLNADDFDSMNFQNPTSMGMGPEVQQPKMLMCQLKNYQLKGLNWLVNLYEQGINGILADEMGLGKTVQSISLMAYLAETNNIWGPFLIIAPASTLHNWQQEVTRFVPGFRVLPYWGNPKDRKTLRQFWTKKQLYGKDAPFHVVITSYQLVVTDVQYFQRVKWQYMVLDEAQAIKSSASARWKILLGFHCRNRLLLTGTPIQNSMQELWALLHFIMPTLFDSHEEFSEWFSKDIESHAENKGTLNEHQLRRLHMILKPFMLRRIKRNVQHELGEKIEVELYCDLTARQRALYRGLKEKLSISELLEKATSLSDSDSLDSLMNLVMQFRKVCNHPELFERADVQSPFAFCESSRTMSLSKETYLNCPYSTESVIKFNIPKRLYRNGGILNIAGPESRAGFETRYLDQLLNIWTPENVYQSMYSEQPDSTFSFLRFTDLDASDVVRIAREHVMQRWVSHLAVRDQEVRRRFYHDNANAYPTAPVHTYASFLINQTVSPFAASILSPGQPLYELSHVEANMTSTFSKFEQMYIPTARSPPVTLICSDRQCEVEQRDIMFDRPTRAVLFGRLDHVPKAARKDISDLSKVVTLSDGRGIMPVPISDNGFSHIKVPAMSDLILDSGKLHKLDKLLEQLKAEGHRCLIYFQMTKMIDLMEEYISYKQYKYMRLDGSSKISDRRDMVTDWQTRPEIFIFLLSTRAGGLGINLTAADTVIFYDSDWNPTVDQQAMDRAHRLGQTKQVTVYRLITKGTIEERILMRAKQKDEIQKVVISGGEFKQVDFKPREIVSLLLDDEEMDSQIQQQLKRKAEEDEATKEKRAASAAKRPRKGASKDSTPSETPAQSPYAVDKLFSAGGDHLPEDDTSGASSPSPFASKKKTGRPRTQISFG
ncbi:SNF2 family N-terminal domain-containing protein [Umbelopsis sp. PMI_123]|nr:SNF2 family N-terminal domain-containing protein [Umbelopsis sp. PMI_123]